MILRTLLQQWTSIVISIALALVVWVVATGEENPMREDVFADPIPIQYSNRPEGLTLTSPAAGTVKVTVRAPAARWQTLRPEDFQAVVDLVGAQSGVRSFQITVTCVDSQVTIITSDPQTVSLHLEPLKQTIMDIRVRVTDDPPVGFEVKSTSVQPARVVVLGPQSFVDQVNDATAEVGLRGAKAPFDRQAAVTLHDAQGNVVQDVNVSPNTVSVHVEIDQRVGYKEVAVKPVVRGSVASGYWVSDIAVNPSTVTLVGPPQSLDKIPGFVDAEAVTVTGSKDDINKQVGLTLPAGVTALNAGNVDVRVSVEPVLGGITILRPVRPGDSRCGLPVVTSPDTVEVILSGPLPILQALTADDVQILVDVTNCTASTFQVTPRVANLPGSIKVESIVPNTVEVNIQPR